MFLYVCHPLENNFFLFGKERDNFGYDRLVELLWDISLFASYILSLVVVKNKLFLIKRSNMWILRGHLLFFLPFCYPKIHFLYAPAKNFSSMIHTLTFLFSVNKYSSWFFTREPLNTFTTLAIQSYVHSRHIRKRAKLMNLSRSLYMNLFITLILSLV